MSLTIVHDEQGASIENYVDLHLIEEVHSYIELSIIKWSDSYVHLTFPCSNLDVRTSSHYMDWKALHISHLHIAHLLLVVSYLQYQSLYTCSHWLARIPWII